MQSRITAEALAQRADIGPAACKLADAINAARDAYNESAANFQAQHGCLSDENERTLRLQFCRTTVAAFLEYEKHKAAH